MKSGGEKFQPLPVTALVEPEDTRARRQAGRRCRTAPARSSISTIPRCRPRNWNALRFVLNDLGWDGYLGFVEEGTDNLHIGCSPTSRDFFTAYSRKRVGEGIPEVSADAGARRTP